MHRAIAVVASIVVSAAGAAGGRAQQATLESRVDSIFADGAGATSPGCALSVMRDGAPMAGWRWEADVVTQKDVLEITSRQTALNFEPGRRYLYSNTGFTLLAVVVERVTGRTLREFTTQRIFEPLGMEATHFHDDHQMIVRNRAWAYAPDPDGAFGLKNSIPDFEAKDMEGAEHVAEGGDDSMGAAAETVAVPRDDLLRLTGVYRGDSPDRLCLVAAEDEGLRMTLGGEPTTRDVFHLRRGVAEFTRDARGRIDGFTLSDGRVWGVRFDRTRK